MNLAAFCVLNTPAARSPRPLQRVAVVQTTNWGHKQPITGLAFVTGGQMFVLSWLIHLFVLLKLEI